ncbi:AraC family transcriptional regulator [Streptomyces evansiae]|uniref:AraC family transcriptional regulator n=1 Tax=Streptomyces evansiae TaxID=3075535 RepID=UPI0037D9C8EA
MQAGTTGSESFEQWRETMRHTRAAELTSDHADTFTAVVHQTQVGSVSVLRTSFPSIQVRRTQRMIRRCDQELYHLTLLTSGSGLVETGGAPQPLTAGNLHLVASPQPYDARFRGEPGASGERAHVDGVGVDLPMSMLPLPARRVRPLLGRALPADRGAGVLLATFLTGLAAQAALLRPGEAARLSTATVDLLSAWLAGELDIEGSLPPQTRQAVMLHRVKSFILQNLHHPDLTPSVVAAAHHVSLSYLHREFTRDSQGETLAAFIRRQRLAKAYRDLADPALHDLPVHVVAARCGIPQASVFTRAFKATHGMTPSDHRRRARTVVPPGSEQAQAAE